MTQSKVARLIWAVLLLVMLAAISCLCGAVSISGATVLATLGGQTAQETTEQTILLQLRLPRVVVGMLVGGALAAAGVGFQGLFRNPLAEPYVIGASSGAALGVAIAIVAGWRVSLLSLGATSLMAMAGSLLVVVFVLSIGSLTQGSSTTALLLAGVVIGSMVNALVSGLLFLFDHKAIVILSWLMGSLADSHWGTAGMVAVVSGVGVLAIAAMARPLDAYGLGDTASQSLGLDVRQFRRWIIAAASLATAGAVAASGVIGFVGLISPHIARKLVGPRHAHLIPMSICVGAGLMLVADTIARTIIAPAELPVGIVTALLGCPFFLWLLYRHSRRAENWGVMS